MDWIGLIINLIGWYIVPKHNVKAVSWFLVGNIMWISWGISQNVWSIIILQGCFIFLNIRSIIIWRELTIPPPNSWKELIVTPFLFIIVISYILVIMIPIAILSPFIDPILGQPPSSDPLPEKSLRILPNCIHFEIDKNSARTQAVEF